MWTMEEWGYYWRPEHLSILSERAMDGDKGTMFFLKECIS